jgi:hypothetical protein
MCVGYVMQRHYRTQKVICCFEIMEMKKSKNELHSDDDANDNHDDVNNYCIQFFIFMVLTQQLQEPIREQHGRKYKTNNKNI